MARLIYSKQVFVDFERLTDFLIEIDPVAAVNTVTLIEEAVSILERHPLISRPVSTELRELIVSRGRTGHVVLYRFFPESDMVFILAIRHQREAGYEA